MIVMGVVGHKMWFKNKEHARQVWNPEFEHCTHRHTQTHTHTSVPGKLSGTGSKGWCPGQSFSRQLCWGKTVHYLSCMIRAVTGGQLLPSNIELQ